MSIIDIEALLADLSPEAPSGEDMSYDPSYLELERAVQGTAEKQVGESVIEAVEPNWKEIRDLCLGLCGKTRDLRVIIYLTLSIMKLNRLSGLKEGLTLLSGTLNRHWDTVFPQLDPSDNNDPMERMNIIASMAVRDAFQDPVSFLKRLREVPIIRAPQLGSFDLNDIMIARGEISPPEGMENPPKEAHIQGALAAGNQEELAAEAAAAADSVAALKEINGTLTAKVGSGQAPDLSGLEEVLMKITSLFSRSGPAAPAGSGPQETYASAGSAQAAYSPHAGNPAAGGVLSGEIQTRDDVVKALDLICRYYERFEPSSPLPLLLKRARRLVTLDFLEIVRELTPEAAPAVEALGGIKAGSEAPPSA